MESSQQRFVSKGLLDDCFLDPTGDGYISFLGADPLSGTRCPDNVGGSNGIGSGWMMPFPSQDLPVGANIYGWVAYNCTTNTGPALARFALWTYDKFSGSALVDQRIPICDAVNREQDFVKTIAHDGYAYLYAYFNGEAVAGSALGDIFSYEYIVQ